MRRKAVVAFQCMALTFGLGTLLLCANLFGVLRQNPSIPGVHCGADVKRLALAQSNGVLTQRFTYAQAQALVKAAPDLVMRYAGLSLEIQNGQDPARRGSVIAADPTLFAHMCIRTSTGEWPADGANQAVTSRNNAGTLRLGAGQFEISGTSTEFRGLYGKSSAATFIPISSLGNAGVDTSAIDLPSVTLLLDPAPSGIRSALQAVDAVVAGNPAIFGVNSSLIAQPILPIGANEAKRLSSFSGIIALVGAAFLFLGILTVISYQFGRIGDLAANLSLIRELGAPQLACIRFSIAEPAGIFAAAILIALPLELLLRKALAAWLGFPSGLSPSNAAYASAVSALFLLCATCSILIGLVILRLARANITRRAKRVVQKTFQYVSAFQAAVCLLAILPAIASIFSYWKAVPSSRGYSVEDVRVHPLFLAMDMLPEDFTNRAPGLLREIDAQTGGVSAISTTAFPLPGEGAWTAAVNYQGKTFNLEVNAVTASYFKVLQLPVVEGRLFNSEDQPRSGDATPTVAVANREAAKLLKVGSFPSSPLIIGKESSAYKATVSLIGVVDEKTSGTEAPDSLDRLRPAIYVPWKADGPFLLTVRHPAEVRQKVVDDTIWQTLDTYLPVWRDAELPDHPVTLKSLYLKATAPQRTMLYLFAAAAAGSVLLAFSGLLGSGLMALGLNLRSLAVKFTLGATRRHLILDHLRKTATPLLGATMLALGLAAVASKPIADFMQLSFGEMLFALVASVFLVLFFGMLGVGFSCRGLLTADFSKALRGD